MTPEEQGQHIANTLLLALLLGRDMSRHRETDHSAYADHLVNVASEALKSEPDSEAPEVLAAMGKHLRYLVSIADLLTQMMKPNEPTPVPPA